MLSFELRSELDDIIFDLKWAAEYIEDLETMREKVLGLVGFLAEIAEKGDI